MANVPNTITRIVAPDDFASTEYVLVNGMPQKLPVTIKPTDTIEFCPLDRLPSN